MRFIWYGTAEGETVRHLAGSYAAHNWIRAPRAELRAPQARPAHHQPDFRCPQRFQSPVQPERALREGISG